ncbi:Omp28-related outer membrane protein [bacterium]|nr:Omp28-related outer membrane protein [bacterium]
MKLNALAVLGLIVFFSACTETPPSVDFSSPELFLIKEESSKLNESERPDPQFKNALLEDITGVRCTNCPDAAKKAKAIKDANPDRVVLVGVYTSLYTNLTQPHHDDLDLRTQVATDIHGVLYGSPPLPGGGVNRVKFDGQSGITLLKEQWATRVNDQLEEISEVNLDANLEWVNDTTVDINAVIHFNKDRDDQVYFSIMMLEDGLVTAQSDKPGLIEEYEHEHVLRKMYTPYNGTPLITEAEEGEQLTISWRVYLPDNVSFDKSSLVLFLNLNEDDTKEVLQCTELKLY